MEKNTYQLALEDIYMNYQTNAEKKTVLNDIDLHIKKEEFITIIGPTGCGKSTLLRLILGIEKPTSGTMLINGKEIDDVNRNRGIVFQKYSLFPHLTVRENIMLGLELEKLNMAQSMISRTLYELGNNVIKAAEKISFPFKTKIRDGIEKLIQKNKFHQFKEKADEYIKIVNLSENDANKYPHQLSGGMQQRVAIAQAMIMEPEILLMDEPFGALDPSTRERMQLWILEQWEKTSVTIFFVTHDLEEALFLGTRILALSQHYTTDMPDTSATQGSKIVTDAEVPKATSESTKQKYTQEFNELLERVRKDLNPKNRKYIGDFDLTHPDSFRTVREEEWNGKNRNGKK